MTSRTAIEALDALRSALGRSKPLAEQQTGQKARTLGLVKQATLAITKFANYGDFLNFALQETSLVDSLSQTVVEATHNSNATLSCACY